MADKTAHFAALHEAEKIVSEDYGFIPVAYYNDFWLQSTSLKGTWHSPYGYWYLQYAYLADSFEPAKTSCLVQEVFCCVMKTLADSDLGFQTVDIRCAKP